MTETPYWVESNKDEGFIRINRHSREMLYWDAVEWEEDPTLIHTIVQAIDLALRYPAEMDTKMREMKKLE